MLDLARRHGDLVLALALAVLATAEILAWADHDRAASVTLALLMTLPLGVRRSAALGAFVLVMLGVNLLLRVQPGFDNDSASLVVSYFVALYSVGRHAVGRDAWLGAVGVVACMLLFGTQESDGLAGADLGDLAFMVVFVGSPWLVGLTLRLRQEREAVLRARHEALRAEQEELARRAVAEERSQIARELHDVVSHAISVTVLQARGARRQLDSSPEDVRKALDAIEQTNTAALGDMRRLLAVLRDTEGDTAGHHPQPSLAHLDALLDHVRESGVPVSVEVVGDPGEVPPGVDLSAYRIVQEALTNVIKHAGHATAAVTLDYRPDALAIRVRDTGHGPGARTGRDGHGLIGIRERVAVVGGEVTAGAGPDGGFEISARLPYALESV